MTNTTAPAAKSGEGKLNTRDYIYIGVYTVLYFVLICVAAMIANLIPGGQLFMGLACGILGGVPYMLVLMKSRHFGAVTIVGVLLALIMGVIHGNWYTIVTAVVSGVVADLIARAGGYRKLSLNVLSAGVFNLWNLGLFLPFYIGRNDYLAAQAAKKGAEWAENMANLFPTWMLPVIIIMGVVGGFVGAWIAKLLMRKHFQRAGLV
ncbi:MptD family putative ECF transporter S component [Bifidobacterium vespertilionis]|uniref:Trep_Strep domain-containing protein n=1 Tax=Bifidobacterium vespertilionis TaxID=2562524 RepID=A0A5J5DXS4_9BIFI|nr:MptD family putative ECF transporter S component [Bifidobacterium vespertilionis]KAA8816204.1 Trep_Strep domain-containing protein [Bifidobacterium vespertilionis]KAA8821540.1 Trep_Strep domain-containing protein [Bifidobacterium vespertilionis]